MNTLPGVLAVLRPKSREVIAETENVVVVATSLKLELVGHVSGAEPHQFKINRVNLLPSGGNYLSLDEASEISGMKIEKIKQLVKLGKLGSTTGNGGDLLILRRDLEDYLQKR